MKYAYNSSLQILLLLVLGASLEQSCSTENKTADSQAYSPAPIHTASFESQPQGPQPVSEAPNSVQTLQPQPTQTIYDPANKPQNIPVTYNNQVTHHKPFVIILGGFRSCNHDFHSQDLENPNIFSRSHDLIQEMEYQHQAPIPYMMSCYRTRNPCVKAINSNSPRRSKKICEEELADYILSLTETYHSLIIIGHSYGGWLAMRTALALEGRRHITKLFTIDPISPLTCNNPLQKGCRHAPEDFSEQSLLSLSSYSDLWVHFYQRESMFLKSEAIDEADLNFQEDSKHAEISTDLSVWNTIKSQMLF